MLPITNKQPKYYFPADLKDRLSQISKYPLTVIEAPSGFGKTTSIREYLRNELSHAVFEWYTCLGESAALAWTEICRLFTRIDREVGDEMQNLKMPSMETLLYMKSCLKSLKCQRETYLVIDNYQMINFDMHWELINTFSMHENPNLHIIFIMQQLDFRKKLYVHNNNIYGIDGPSFFFNKEDIAILFRLEGLRLTESQAENIFMNTEGWISAIRLQMINYRETGSFVHSVGIEKLVEMAVWNRLKSEEQDFLLTMSVFDNFTAHQAAAMMDYKIIPGEIEEKLKISDFVRFLPKKRLFIIHSILLDYLRNKFNFHRSREYQSQILYKAGLSCASMGQYCLAAKFFYQIGKFESILSLPFTRQYLGGTKRGV